MMLLSVDRINVAYGAARVLSEVSLTLDKGERVFVVGRNGAGKTTLLKTIAGFLTPTEGDILFDGEKVNALHPEQMANRGVRYVYQDKRVFTRLTVRENIQLAAFASKEKLTGKGGQLDILPYCQSGKNPFILIDIAHSTVCHLLRMQGIHLFTIKEDVTFRGC